MKINTVFESIQGEGRYVGYPSLFIRLSGCTRSCNFCDSKYHTEGKKYSTEELSKRINKSSTSNVVWTGGEPLLQFEEIKSVIDSSQGHSHHLETNGDLFVQDSNLISIVSSYFTYIVMSPKELSVIKQIQKQLNRTLISTYDIKVVTDLAINLDLLEYATMLMPLTTYDKEKDLLIKKRVWKYCVEHKLLYSPRIHIDIWDKQRGV